MTPWNARLAVAVLALTALATGCGEDPDPTAAEPTPTPRASVSRSPEPSPTSTETTQPSPSSTPAPTPAPKRELVERLLPPAELPGFNETFTWNSGVTEAGEPTFGVLCEEFSLLSIGAKSAVHRTYVATDGSFSTGLEIVAEFPDPMTAKRAYSVLRSWYAECPQDHDGDPDVSAFAAVPLGSSGTAGWHLLTYGTTFDAHGIVQRGARIAVVVLTLRDAQDYDYEPGHEPMVDALQRAAALL